MPHLIWNEWRVLRRQTGLWILVAAYVVLLGYGAIQSVDRVRDRAAQLATVTEDYHQRWSALRAAADGPPSVWADWKSASLVGGSSGFSVTWIPVDGLAVLSAGESTRVSPVRRISLYAGDEEPVLQNPLAPAGGLFDLSFVVVWLLPLTLLAATHGVVSADRQQGTWALVAATTRTPGRVLGARLAWPATVCIVTTVIAGLASVLASAQPPDSAGWGRFAAWAGLVTMYGAFWTMAAGVATARCATATHALGIIGLLWMALVWVVPGLIDAAVVASQPTADKVGAYVAVRETGRNLDEKLPGMLEDVYRRYPQWRPSPDAVAAANRPVPGGPASRDARRVYVPALAAAEIAASYADAVTMRRAWAERAVRYASIVSPALAFQLIGDHLAGTSAEHFLAFERHAREAERAWHEFFAPRILQLRDLTRADLAAVPALAPFSDMSSVPTLAWPVAVLSLWTASAAALLVRSRRHLRG